ncbi:bifunctional folylpolyglutamate synthase/dihydrofolate synthase [Acetivibrio saccincola]|jgi:dihydrofolate synthase/folylpolyglutamate synthase|uniref:tetrahydrofolate synthase n=1 Tax=Acetivibrio saccincola TaxID=1677857 RepID=A0A2K9EDG4_9FIRM|nr:folylpolyglutamate synthase/dihydrofolate synthase family protein [Acetivibrio saccincola]AUG58184.1 Folylpolyglutamate synthase [Acetivibrio saccincola]NLW26692.1 bifunctional folylpolyglutamate synthase/dihydrofolate synthase [Acetivibrio saccincola]PQQ68066.1 bifunctional folylpolyglutamate synthase/dihydrofolate synthase [Acetivibrio saccincola]HOA96446.1 folylpolyglutamate synthase/dihydrofolate synthase family protein [Acetivibrio saccincola]HQD27680.1 folylpolyglutamate synthase/dihy
MDYQEAVNYVNERALLGINLGLDRIKTLLDLMGNPQEKLKCIHVAGTNGKGSVIAMISSILNEAGYNVGGFISPYIESIEDSILVNGKKISKEDFVKSLQYVKEKARLMGKDGYFLTEFEILTATGFWYFYNINCDIVLLEVGLGGRLDSTNVIESPLVSVISNIDYDHTGQLGNTLTEIAYEKAGIIKKDSLVVLYPQKEEVEKVIEEVCKKNNAFLIKTDFSKINVKKSSIEGQEFDFGKRKSIKINLLGKHQINNAALVIDTIDALIKKGYSISENAIKRGLFLAKWPGRLEVLKKNPLFIIDGAHNLSGAKVLKENLETYFPHKKIIFITGIFKDKDYVSMIKECSYIASKFIIINLESKRGLDAEELAKIAKRYCNNVVISDTIERAVRTGINDASADDVVCAFGSLSFVGTMRRMFKT